MEIPNTACISGTDASRQRSKKRIAITSCALEASLIGFGKRGSFQKSPLSRDSRDSRQFRDSRDLNTPPRLWKTKEGAPFATNPFSGPDSGPGLAFRSFAFKNLSLCVCVVKPT